MTLQRSTYTVKGISHHDVAERLGVWLPECVGRMVTLVVESAEENEIGVECVAVYDEDEHLGYIDDNQKQELLAVLHTGHRHTLRSHIIGYNEGKGAEGKVFSYDDVLLYATRNKMKSLKLNNISIRYAFLKFLIPELTNISKKLISLHRNIIWIINTNP